MNATDLILILLLGLASAYGFYRGAIRQVSSLLGVILGIMAGKVYAQGLGEWMIQHIGLPDYLFPALSFIILFIIMLIICGVCGKMVQRMVYAAGMGIVNHGLGALVSFLKWLLVLSIILNLGEILTISEIPVLKKSKNASSLYEPIRKVLPTIFPSVPITIEHETKGFIKQHKKDLKRSHELGV